MPAIANTPAISSEMIPGGRTVPFRVRKPGHYEFVAWSDAEWAALPEHERPDDAVRIPGMGWARFQAVCDRFPRLA